MAAVPSRRHPRRRRVSMREVADRAGVGMSSVSRVLSGHADVSDDMRAVVMRSVEELGYVPNALAQSLRTERTMTVGFTLSDISNPVLAQAVTGAARRLRLDGYSVLLADAEGDPGRDATDIRLLARRRVDGLLLSLADERDAATHAALEEIAVPAVLLDRDRPPGLDAWRVSFDHQAGMRVAAEHLFELGHRDVALIGGGPRRPARQRRRGVEQVFGRTETTCAIHEGGFDIEHGARATQEILAMRPRPTAIIAAGNMLMHGALRALHEAGVRIGTDISIVGCDDVAVAEFHDPPIALVRRDARELGRVAAEMLIAAIEAEEGTEPADVLLPTEFVARASAAPPRRRQRQ